MIRLGTLRSTRVLERALRQGPKRRASAAEILAVGGHFRQIRYVTGNLAGESYSYPLSETETLETTIRHPAKSRQTDGERCPRGLPVSSRVPRVLRSCALLVVAAMFAFVPVTLAQVQLPDFGDSSAKAFSNADERAIGEAFMREIRANLRIINDPETEQYIQSIGYRIV